jgi:hypothetical protein
VRLRDAENGRELLVDAADRRFADEYSARNARRQRELESTLRRAGADLVSVDVSGDVIDPLQRFFRRRERIRR